jgi:hypothetical protein
MARNDGKTGGQMSKTDGKFPPGSDCRGTNRRSAADATIVFAAWYILPDSKTDFIF